MAQTLMLQNLVLPNLMLPNPNLQEKPDVRCHNPAPLHDKSKLLAGKVSDQRDISPGTLPDGRHVQTAGDRGEVYEVSKMSKFKNKLGFGKG